MIKLNANLQNVDAPNTLVRPHLDDIGRPGHAIPFIARQTRAYLNFEVKDAPKARGLRPSAILEFKAQIRFSAAGRRMVFSAQLARGKESRVRTLLYTGFVIADLAIGHV